MPQYSPYLSDYGKKCGEFVDGRVNYVDTEVIHRYHGHRDRRGYFSRLDLLKGINFDEDLERDSSGLFRWTDSNKNKPFEIFFSMKDENTDEKCEYYGIDKHYDIA